MTVNKFVLLLDADDDVGPTEREAAAAQLIERAASAPANLAGLTVGTVIEPLTGPAHTLAVVQCWIDDTDGTATTAVIDQLTDAIASSVSIWLTDEIILLAPTERVMPTAEHNRVNLFGTAAKRDDFSTDAFFEYWKTTHAPISASVPGLTGYVVSRVQQTVNAPLGRAADAFIELWWPSHESFIEAGDSPAQAAAWKDVPNYARTDGQFWLTHEHVVIVPPNAGPGLLDQNST